MATKQEKQLEEAITGQKHSVKKSEASNEPVYHGVPLPSKGILYQNQEEVALQGVWDGQIFIRPMTLAEMELFLKAEYTETGSMIDVILNRCIKSDIDVAQLMSSDRMYLFIILRALSFGDLYVYRHPCEHCGKLNEQSVRVSDLPVITLDEIHGKKDKNGAITKASIDKIKEPFAVELPMSKITVYFRLSRGRDEIREQTDKYFEQAKKDQKKKKSALSRNKEGKIVIRNIDPTLEDESDEDQQDESQKDVYNKSSIGDGIVRQIVAIEGYEKSEFEDLIKNQLTAGDGMALYETIKNSDSGLDLERDMVCAYCNKESTYDMPITESFYRSSL